MTAYVWSMFLLAGTTVLVALALDCLLRGLVRGFARFLPDELCGPDGWLVDTTGRRGVFDVTARR